MEKALTQAHAGRLHILDKMLEEITKPRREISPHAPKITTITVKPDKIREIIGPGGKVIRSIQTESNTQVSIDDSGLLKIAATSQEDSDTALKLIKEIIREAEVGKIYEGTVVKIMDFGAFVQLFPGTDGLCHISQLAKERVNKVTDVVQEGDTLKVKVLEINGGKIRLSHKVLL